MCAGHRHHVEQAVGNGVAGGGDVGMRAAWNTGSPTSRRKAPTLVRNGASGCDMPGMLCSASARSVSMRPKMALKKSTGPRARKPGEPHAFLEADIPRYPIDHETDADDIIVANSFADSPVHHQAEARAVFPASRRSVGAPVGARRQEQPIRWPVTVSHRPARLPLRRTAAAGRSRR